MTSPRSLVLVGAGGFARETVEVVAAINARREQWKLLGFVDDDPSKQGLSVCGLPILGASDWVIERDVQVSVCVGNADHLTSRLDVISRLNLTPSRFATLIHPTAVIPSSVDVGVGSVIHALCVSTGWATIGANVAMMPGVIMTHDDNIEDCATVAAGVRRAGGVSVGSSAYLGSGVLVRENLRIGACSLVGMGSVVTRSVPDGEVWMGSPARFVRNSNQSTSRDVHIPALSRRSMESESNW